MYLFIHHIACALVMSPYFVAVLTLQVHCACSLGKFRRGYLLVNPTSLYSLGYGRNQN